MSKAEVLIIDDEPQIRKLLQITLESQDYKVWEAENARSGLALAAHHPPDLILLDLNLPDLSGHEVLTELKGWFTRPVIILSVVNEEADIVKALDNGATDYVTKPFRSAELLARVRAALMRSPAQAMEPVSTFGNLTLDLPGHLVKKNGEPVKLTATEFKLIALLARNQGRVLTHHYILKEIWGVGYQTETQYLRVFINTLRKKIEDDPHHPAHIVTESGVGYRFS